MVLVGEKILEIMEETVGVVGKGMGEGIRGFKDALQQGSQSDRPDSAAKEQ